MKIKVARTAGFCMGVRRAVNLTLDSVADRPQPVYTLGPLIHNPQVVDQLESRGVVKSDDIPASGTVIIRSHGVAPEIYKELKSRGIDILNGTCPRVARVQGIVRRHYKKGYLVVILGDRGHAEVDGIVAYADGNAIVIEEAAGVDSLPEADKVCLVSQTTQDRAVFEETARLLKNRYSDLKPEHVEIVDTICDSTGNRQREVRRLAKQVDAIVVVGGKSSANTRRLVQVAREEGVPTFSVETELDVDHEGLSAFRTVGLTAGTSTPNWMIRRVYGELSKVGARGGIFEVARKIFRWMILANFHLAIGAIALTYAAAVMQGFQPFSREYMVSMLYLFSIHTVSVIVDPRVLELNVPARAEVFGAYRKFWLAACIISVVLAAFISFSMGLFSGLFFMAVAVTSFLYSVILFRGGKWELPLRWIVDIPGSKDIFMALGWAAVVAAMPWVNHPYRPEVLPSTIVAFIMVFGLVFVRSLLCDFMDIQGDRLIGRETLPVALNITITRTILVLTLAGLAAMVVVATLAGFLPNPRGYFFLIPLAYAGACVPLFTRQPFVYGFRAESVIDAVFIITGITAVLV